MPEKKKALGVRSTNKKKAHNALIHNTMVEVQLFYPQCRLFRSEPTLARQFHSHQVMKFGVKGMPDLYGFIPVAGVAVFTGIEIKTGKAVLTQEQKDMQGIIQSLGGIYVVGREEIYETIKELQKRMTSIEEKLSRFSL